MPWLLTLPPPASPALLEAAAAYPVLGVDQMLSIGASIFSATQPPLARVRVPYLMPKASQGPEVIQEALAGISLVTLGGGGVPEINQILKL